MFSCSADQALHLHCPFYVGFDRPQGQFADVDDDAPYDSNAVFVGLTAKETAAKKLRKQKVAASLFFSDNTVPNNRYR